MPSPPSCSRRLSILAGVSVGMLAVLLVGHFARLGADFEYFSPREEVLSIRGLNISVNRGLFEVVFSRLSGVPADPSLPAGFHHRFFFVPGPLMKDALRGLHMYRVRGIGYECATVQLPLWCLMLPCTIAPLLWLRRRRRREQRGFAVEPAAKVNA